ncbi:MAG: hypothetical protein IE909_02465 [Campylobacterales bacterium]|nr:hypothetical protein [Campylobacterales bacterium]
MVIVITTALVETLAKHMFNKYLEESDKIQIGGAPSWYMKPIDDRMCVFTHQKGGLDSIEIAKNDSKIKMEKKINGVIEIVIYDNLKHVKDTQEKAVVDLFRIDSQLPVFVNKNIDFSRVSYEDDVDTTFVRACIDKNVIVEYQKERLTKIQEEVVKHKANKAYNELEGESSEDIQRDSKDPFSELPKN